MNADLCAKSAQSHACENNFSYLTSPHYIFSARHVEGGAVRWNKEKANLVIHVEEDGDDDVENKTSTPNKDEL